MADHTQDDAVRTRKPSSEEAWQHEVESRRQKKQAEKQEQVQALTYMSSAILALTVALFLSSYMTKPSEPRGYARQYSAVEWQEGRRHNQKVRDSTASVQVSLAQLYRQEQVNISVSRRKICSRCGGIGGEGRSKCSSCNGRGAIIQHAHVGGGMYQQFQQTCPHCGGSGTHVLHKCHVCGGSGVHEVHEQVPLRLSAGLRAGDLVRLPMFGDEHPGADGGDLLVAIEEVEAEFDVDMFEAGVVQPVIRRKAWVEGLDETQQAVVGSEGGPGGGLPALRALDLETEIQITWLEALFGFHRQARHLGGHSFPVSSRGVTSPGAVIMVRGQGMRGRPDASSAQVRDGTIELLPTRWANTNQGVVLIEQQRPGIDGLKPAPQAGDGQRDGEETSTGAAAVLSALSSIGRSFLGMRRDSVPSSGSSAPISWPVQGNLYVRVMVSLPSQLSAEQEEVVHKYLS